MFNSNYAYLKYGVLYVAEGGEEPRRCGFGTAFLKLDDEEIAAIRKSLHKISQRRIPDVADAEDLVQDTLLAMITSHPGGEMNHVLDLGLPVECLSWVPDNAHYVIFVESLAPILLCFGENRTEIAEKSRRNTDGQGF